MEEKPYLRPVPADTPALELEWQTTRQVFRAFQTVAPPQRLHHLGLLYEKLAPWIGRGIRFAVIRHFLLLPTEMLTARVFAKTARRDHLHEAYQTYFMWIEGMILRELADPADELGIYHGAPGEPSLKVQERFNFLPMQDRALLYLYMVEKYSLSEVSAFVKIPMPRLASLLVRIWNKVREGDPSLQLPLPWRIPDNLRLDQEAEDGGTE